MSFWSALRLLFTLHCQESTQLVSAGFERELSAVERWAVRLHWVVCRSCRRFLRQMRFLQQAGRARRQQPSLAGLSPEARRKILDRLRSLGES